MDHGLRTMNSTNYGLRTTVLKDGVESGSKYLSESKCCLNPVVSWSHSWSQVDQLLQRVWILLDTISGFNRQVCRSTVSVNQHRLFWKMASQRTDLLSRIFGFFGFLHLLVVFVLASQGIVRAVSTDTLSPSTSSSKCEKFRVFVVDRSSLRIDNSCNM